VTGQPRFEIVVAGNEDDGNIGGFRSAADDAAELVTVHARQSDVEEQQTRHFFGQALHALLGRFENLDRPRDGKIRFQQIPRQLVVIDDEQGKGIIHFRLPRDPPALNETDSAATATATAFRDRLHAQVPFAYSSRRRAGNGTGDRPQLSLPVGAGCGAAAPAQKWSRRVRSQSPSGSSSRNCLRCEILS